MQLRTAALTIRSRLRVASVAIVVILVGAGVIGWWAVARLSTEIEEQMSAAATVQRLMSVFTSSISTELRAGEHYLVRPDSATRELVESSRRDAHRVHAILVRRYLPRRSTRGEADAALVARLDDELSMLEAILSRAHRMRDVGDPAAASLLSQGEAIERELRADMARLDVRQNEDVINLGVEMRGRAATRALVLALVLAVAALLVLLLSWQVGRSVTRPLSTLVERARALQRGGTGEHVVLAAMPGEFQILGEAMNQAGDSLAALADAQAALHRSEKLAAIGTLISGVAHELNNPLQTIRLVTENLHESGLGDEVSADLELIRDQVSRASAIIRDLLTSVRSDDAPREMIALNQLVPSLERELGDLAGRNGVTFVFTVDPLLPPLPVDRVGIAQVLTNLVENAAHAAGHGGTVWFEARVKETGCVLVVEDNGPGIEPAVLRRIFEPLFTTKAAGKGTGLGLPVSRGIVERMGGQLTARGHSRENRRGASFRVILPTEAMRLAAAEKSATEPELSLTTDELPIVVRDDSVPSPRNSDERPRMLVVDDEPSIRSALRRFFERRDWRIDVAADGLEALAILDAEGDDAFTLVLSDIRMPHMNGIELHDVLKARSYPVAERFVVLSGDLVSTEVAAFLARMSSPVLSKPIDLAELLRTAQRIAANRETRNSAAVMHEG